MKILCLNTDYCKGCHLCLAVCPKGAIRASARINAKGYLLPEEADMSNCSGCKLCEIVCPDFAITIDTDS